jgi:hypothetical protein
MKRVEKSIKSRTPARFRHYLGDRTASRMIGPSHSQQRISGVLMMNAKILAAVALTLVLGACGGKKEEAAAPVEEAAAVVEQAEPGSMEAATASMEAAGEAMDAAGEAMDAAGEAVEAAGEAVTEAAPPQ